VERCWEVSEDTSTARVETRYTMNGRLVVGDTGGIATKTTLITGGGSISKRETADELMFGSIMTYDLVALAALMSLIYIR
jgi:hypothetical protein